MVIGSQYVDILPDKYYSFLHAGTNVDLFTTLVAENAFPLPRLPDETSAVLP